MDRHAVTLGSLTHDEDGEASVAFLRYLVLSGSKPRSARILQTKGGSVTGQLGSTAHLSPIENHSAMLLSAIFLYSASVLSMASMMQSRRLSLISYMHAISCPNGTIVSRSVVRELMHKLVTGAWGPLTLGTEAWVQARTSGIWMGPLLFMTAGEGTGGLLLPFALARILYR